MIAALDPQLATPAWIAAIAAVVVAIVLAAAAIRLERPRIGLVALAPVVVGALATLAGVDLAPPDPLYRAGLALALAALGVVAGYPVTVFALGLATPRAAPRDKPGKRTKGKKSDDADVGEHGGIVVDDEKGGRGRREVLRGGWVIGYLERIAVIAAIALGRFEVVAAVIAVKGLGRFTELDSSAARERFIIGTLTSLIWAGACGALVAAALR